MLARRLSSSPPPLGGKYEMSVECSFRDLQDQISPPKIRFFEDRRN